MAPYSFRPYICCRCTHPPLDPYPFMPLPLCMARAAISHRFACIGRPSVPRITFSRTLAHAQRLQCVVLWFSQCRCCYGSSRYVLHNRLPSLDHNRTHVSGQSRLTTRTATSVAVNSLIILSTMQSQDFRDQVGDKQIARRTIPIVWPIGSRISMFTILAAWSVGISCVCGLAYPISVPFCMLAVFIGMRFIWKRTPDDDQRSYQYYGVRC